MKNPSAKREVLLVAAAVLLSRLVLLAVLGTLMHGREFTDDIFTHARLARDPLQILSGHTTMHGQHPPLLPVVEALFIRPLMLVLPDFYAVRLGFVLVELVTSVFLVLSLRKVLPDAGARRLRWLAFALLPMQWMTSVVMAQDEVIAGAWLAAVAWCLLDGRRKTALLLCGVGVVAGKIFLGLPLLVLVALEPDNKARLKGVLLAGAPIAAAYAVTVTAALVRGEPLPLVGFMPRPQFGTSFWAIIDLWSALDGTTARALSTPLALVGAFTALGLYFKRRAGADQAEAVMLMWVMLLWVFVLFYHVCPEYYAITFALPFLARRVPWTSLVLLSGLPWAVNFFYGIAAAEQSGAPRGGRAAFIALYRSVLNVDPALLHQASLVAVVVVAFAVALWMTVRVGRERQQDEALAEAPTV